MTRSTLLQTAFLVGLAGAAHGIDAWTGGTSTDWADGSNWSNGNPPDGTDTVRVNNISDGTTFTPSLTTAYTLDPDGPGGDMWVGGSGTGELNIDNGGSLNVVGNWLFVGENGGTGTINVNSGGAIGGDNNIRLGRTGGNGTLNVNGGTISGVSGIITDGGATSAINVSNNGSVSSTGNIQMHGNSSSGIDSGSITAGSEFWVGGDGDGTTFLQTGGTVSSAAWFVVGRGGTNAEYTMTGGTVNAATSVAGTFASVGAFGGSSGTLNVGGTGEFNVANNRRLYVGEGGEGTLRVSGDGQVNITDTNEGGVRLGQAATGVGTVHLDGGTISTPQVSLGAGSGTFNFNGGLLQASRDESTLTNGTFITGVTANVLDGGANIDSNGFNITSSVDLIASGTGGLDKLGLGSLTLAGSGNSVNGATVSAGTLFITGQLGTTTGTTVSAGASIGGNGTLVGDLALATGATIDISLGALSIDPTATVLFNGLQLTDILGLDLGTAGNGTYSVLDGDFTIDGSSVIANLGEGDALDLGGGRSAWFETGSLSVVIVPEPSVALLGGLGLFALVRRRRRQD